MIETHYSLQHLHTLASPAGARWFAVIHQETQLLQALQFCQQQACRLVVLGGGSNVILPEYIDGLVVQLASRGRRIVEESVSDCVVAFAAGENWHASVQWCLGQGYYGLENLSLIPGSMGAAPIQNIGAYGVELQQYCEYVDVLDISSGTSRRLSNSDCQFGYRDSVFKRGLNGQVVITHVALRLSKQPTLHIDYPPLRAALADAQGRDCLAQLSPQQVAQAVIAIRCRKLPDPKYTPNAGSFFKNPVVSATRYHKLLSRFPDVVAYPIDGGDYKVSAGWLLEKAGWKGRDMEGIVMHAHQALILTNPARHSGRHILAIAQRMIASIESQFDVRLEIEPVSVPGSG